MRARSHVARRRPQAGGYATQCDFSCVDLDHVDISDGTFRHCTFRGADLTYAFLKGAKFEHTDMRLANLNNALATDASFLHTSLAGATCLHANFGMSVFMGDPNTWTSLQAADCSGAFFHQASAEMRAAASHDAARTAPLRDLSVRTTTACDLGAISAQAHFIFTDLSYGSFDVADMRDAVFEQVSRSPACEFGVASSRRSAR